MGDILITLLVFCAIPGLQFFGVFGLLIVVLCYPIGVFQNIFEASWSQIGWAILDVLIGWPVIIGLCLKNK